jgi:hypothetical protein
MSTPNHDTELEEILKSYAYIRDDELGEDKFGGHFDIRKSTAAINTYLYKQTLELIGQDLGPEHYPAGQIYDALKSELRKAAAERWGQE